MRKYEVTCETTSEWGQGLYTFYGNSEGDVRRQALAKPEVIRVIEVREYIAGQFGDYLPRKASPDIDLDEFVDVAPAFDDADYCESEGL